MTEVKEKIAIPKTYRCQHCNGTGFKSLTGPLREICEQLKSGPRNAGELASLIKISTSNALNRLMRLEKLGIVRKQYFSRSAHWFLSSQVPRVDDTRNPTDEV